MRRRGVGRGLPRAHLQADLDIVSLPGSSPSETLLADAETIRTVSEVLELVCTRSPVCQQELHRGLQFWSLGRRSASLCRRTILIYDVQNPTSCPLCLLVASPACRQCACVREAGSMRSLPVIRRSKGAWGFRA